MRIKNYEQLTNHGNIKGRKVAAAIMEAALTAGNPYNNVLKLVSVRDNKLIFDCKEMEPVGDPRSGPEVFDLDKIERIFIFAVGKGILYIVKALEEVLGDKITGGLAVCKHGDELITERVEAIFANHPVPDQNGIEGCRRIMETIASLKLTENDLCITAMGNGCSALAVYPAQGISLEDVSAMNQLCLIDTGMTTDACSYLRNQIDRFRGGRSLRAMRPAKIVNLIGVAPGPRVLLIPDKGFKTPYESYLRQNQWLPNLPDCTTTKAAIEIAKRWRVFDKLPESIRQKLLSNDPENSDTLSWEEYESYNCRTFGLMPQEISAFGTAVSKAKELGFNTYVMTNKTQCEAAPAGQYLANVAAYNLASGGGLFKLPCALFQTGELIVTVNNEKGIGGTNQEFCAAAALNIDGNRRIVAAGIDTDGTDGPGGDFHPEAKVLGIKCLTGGIVDGYTAGEAREKGVELLTAVKTHGTSGPLWELGSGIAATQNIGVGDLQCVLILDEDG